MTITASHSAKILVLGASGLIGNFLAVDLQSRGFHVVGVARKFTSAQRYILGDNARELAIGDADASGLATLIRETAADVIVNCLGTLQTVPGEGDIHEAFVARLIAAIQSAERPVLLIHISIPENAATDTTEFAITKRKADRRIMESGLSYAILRPGFVWAPAAYGGSALLRALAASPFDLPKDESSRPFSAVAVQDIADTVAFLAQRVEAKESPIGVVWDVMHPAKVTVGDVVSVLRRWLGTENSARIVPPRFLLDLGAKAGDAIALLGWRPPVRSTAIAEMRRGVTGDPLQWIAGTGITPRSLERFPAVTSANGSGRMVCASVFSQSVIIVVLTIFWCVSGLIALVFAFKPAADILIAHGFSETGANAATVLSSLMDIGVGLAIAVRRTSRVGLLAGIGVSFFYMIGAALLAPELWIEPLGALVKTGPAIVLMLVALAISDDR